MYVYLIYVSQALNKSGPRNSRRDNSTYLFWNKLSTSHHINRSLTYACLYMLPAILNICVSTIYVESNAIYFHVQACHWLAKSHRALRDSVGYAVILLYNILRALECPQSIDVCILCCTQLTTMSEIRATDLACETIKLQFSLEVNAKTRYKGRRNPPSGHILQSHDSSVLGSRAKTQAAKYDMLRCQLPIH